MRVFDAVEPGGAEERLRGPLDVLLRDGHIAAIGRGLATRGVSTDAESEVVAEVLVLDGSGLTLLPGLVDAHVHLEGVPGAAARNDTTGTRRALQARHLAAYLACGVTTLVDAGSSLETIREVRAGLAAGEPGPRVLFLGPPLTAPGGYGVSGARAVRDGADVSEAFADLTAHGAAGAKLLLERGWNPLHGLPLPSTGVLDRIGRESVRRGIPLYAHALTAETVGIALDRGVHALAHLGFLDSDPDAALVRRLAREGTFVVTTLVATDVHRTLHHPERLERPFVRRVVPERERRTARDRRARDLLAEGAVAWMAPWLPASLRRVAWHWAASDPRLRARVRHQQRVAARLHRAGVRLVVGSDTPGFGYVPHHFHGPATLDEIALLHAAGIPAGAALRAATRVPAEMLGLADEIGTVEVGKRADLVLVEGDPLANPTALARVRWVVRAGEARSPEGWLAR